jgi:hypothetical protein
MLHGHPRRRGNGIATPFAASAKVIGVTIPESFLLRADEIIE